jgi:tRNA(Arg) A34 adenosine deaminase TadA
MNSSAWRSGRRHRHARPAWKLPIGAVNALGDEIIASAWISERRFGRRLAHADVLAMTEARSLP